jgi:hypothetical protein
MDIQKIYGRLIQPLSVCLNLLAALGETIQRIFVEDLRWDWTKVRSELTGILDAIERTGTSVDYSEFIDSATNTVRIHYAVSIIKQEERTYICFGNGVSVIQSAPSMLSADPAFGQQLEQLHRRASQLYLVRAEELNRAQSEVLRGIADVESNLSDIRKTTPVTIEAAAGYFCEQGAQRDDDGFEGSTPGSNIVLAAFAAQADFERRELENWSHREPGSIPETTSFPYFFPKARHTDYTNLISKITETKLSGATSMVAPPEERKRAWSSALMAFRAYGSKIVSSASSYAGEKSKALTSIGSAFVRWANAADLSDASDLMRLHYEGKCVPVLWLIPGVDFTTHVGSQGIPVVTLNSPNSDDEKCAFLKNVSPSQRFCFDTTNETFPAMSDKARVLQNGMVSHDVRTFCSKVTSFVQTSQYTRSVAAICIWFTRTGGPTLRVLYDYVSDKGAVHALPEWREQPPGAPLHDVYYSCAKNLELLSCLMSMCLSLYTHRLCIGSHKADNIRDFMFTHNNAYYRNRPTGESEQAEKKKKKNALHTQSSHVTARPMLRVDCAMLFEEFIVELSKSSTFPETAAQRSALEVAKAAHANLSSKYPTHRASFDVILRLVENSINLGCFGNTEDVPPWIVEILFKNPFMITCVSVFIRFLKSRIDNKPHNVCENLSFVLLTVFWNVCSKEWTESPGYSSGESATQGVAVEEFGARYSTFRADVCMKNFVSALESLCSSYKRNPLLNMLTRQDMSYLVKCNAGRLDIPQLMQGLSFFHIGNASDIFYIDFPLESTLPRLPDSTPATQSDTGDDSDSSSVSSSDSSSSDSSSSDSSTTSSTTTRERVARAKEKSNPANEVPQVHENTDARIRLVYPTEGSFFSIVDAICGGWQCPIKAHNGEVVWERFNFSYKESDGSDIVGMRYPSVYPTHQIERFSSMLSPHWRKGEACGVYYTMPLIFDYADPAETQAGNPRPKVDLWIARNYIMTVNKVRISHGWECLFAYADVMDVRLETDTFTETDEMTGANRHRFYVPAFVMPPRYLSSLRVSEFDAYASSQQKIAEQAYAEQRTSRRQKRTHASAQEQTTDSDTSDKVHVSSAVKFYDHQLQNQYIGNPDGISDSVLVLWHLFKSHTVFVFCPMNRHYTPATTDVYCRGCQKPKCCAPLDIVAFSIIKIALHHKNHFYSLLYHERERRYETVCNTVTNGWQLPAPVAPWFVALVCFNTEPIDFNCNSYGQIRGEVTMTPRLAEMVTFMRNSIYMLNHEQVVRILLCLSKLTKDDITKISRPRYEITEKFSNMAASTNTVPVPKAPAATAGRLDLVSKVEGDINIITNSHRQLMNRISIVFSRDFRNMFVSDTGFVVRDPHIPWYRIFELGALLMLRRSANTPDLANSSFSGMACSHCHGMFTSAECHGRVFAPEVQLFEELAKQVTGNAHLSLPSNIDGVAVCNGCVSVYITRIVDILRHAATLHLLRRFLTEYPIAVDKFSTPDTVFADGSFSVSNDCRTMTVDDIMAPARTTDFERISTNQGAVQRQSAPRDNRFKRYDTCMFERLTTEVKSIFTPQITLAIITGALGFAPNANRGFVQALENNVNSCFRIQITLPSLSERWMAPCFPRGKIDVSPWGDLSIPLDEFFSKAQRKECAQGVAATQQRKGGSGTGNNGTSQPFAIDFKHLKARVAAALEPAVYPAGLVI